MRAVERHIDHDAGRAGDLRVALQPKLLEHETHHLRHFAHLREGDRREGIQIEERIVGDVEVELARVHRVHLDAAEVRDVQQRGGVLRHEEVDRAARAVAFDVRARHPVGGVRGRLLLEKVGSAGAVGHAPQRERPVVKIGNDVGREVVVRGQEVALRIAGLRVEGLGQVRQFQLVAVGFQVPMLPALHRFERSRVAQFGDRRHQ